MRALTALASRQLPVRLQLRPGCFVVRRCGCGCVWCVIDEWGKLRKGSSGALAQPSFLAAWWEREQAADLVRRSFGGARARERKGHGCCRAGQMQMPTDAGLVRAYVRLSLEFGRAAEPGRGVFGVFGAWYLSALPRTWEYWRACIPSDMCDGPADRTQPGSVRWWSRAGGDAASRTCGSVCVVRRPQTADVA